ncbi:hypothetical protein V6N12_056733 [Hibiscus sabdariffa]|uniref:Uncharacterized protein n=1 Tax=Hibiscus sabdariffa TaxID=183260 RepID=A0ABR2DBX1_9ROSI
MEFDSTGDLFGYPGRLSHSVESGAGRRRVFAVGNYVNQRLLQPLHNWLMEALGDLKTDGTFNQSAPLDRLVGAKKIYSIDLKAATDRWPLLIQLDLIKSLFEHEFVDEVGNLLGFTIRKIGRPLQIDYHILSDERDGDEILLNLKTVVLSSTIRPASIQTSRLRPLISHQQKKDWHIGHRGRLARAQKGRPETASKAFANFPSQAELRELSTPFPWSPNPLRLNGDAQGHSAFPEFLRPLAYGSGQAVLPFTLFEGLNSRDEKKGEWEIVRKLSIRSNSICRIREPLVKKGNLYTLQQKRLLTESHPSLPSFSSQDNEAYAQQRYRSSKACFFQRPATLLNSSQQTSGILYPTRREMQRALARFGLRAYACFTRAMRMRVTKALGLSSWSSLLGMLVFVSDRTISKALGSGSILLTSF